MINTYNLKTEVIQAINNKGNGVSANFSKAAMTRLNDIDESEFYIFSQDTNLGSIGFVFNKVLLHTFQTGFSVIMLEVSAKNQHNTALHSSMILEAFDDALFAKGISFNNKKCNKTTNIKGKCKHSDVIFSDLAYGLVGLTAPKERIRAYTHIFVEFNEDIKQNSLSQYLIKLAKHYNEDYHISNNEDDNIESIKHFENVVHYYSREGASTAVIYRDGDSNHVEAYFPNTITKTHLPIHLLTFHLERALNVYATTTIGWMNIDTNISAEALQKLQYNQSVLRNFDVNFIHNVISALSRHNLIYQKLIKVKSIKEQYLKITDNSKFVEKFITEQQRQKEAIKSEAEKIAASKRRTKYCQWSKWGAGAVAFLTVTEICKEIIEIITHNFILKNSAAYDFLDHNGLLIGFVISLIIGIFSIQKVNKNCFEKIKFEHQHSVKDEVEHSTHRTIRLKKQRG